MATSIRNDNKLHYNQFVAYRIQQQKLTPSPPPLSNEQEPHKCNVE